MKTKIADRPHHTSIILSLLAVGISCLSWWESHQGRLIAEEVNRPVLSISNIAPDVGAENDQVPYATFKVTVRNIGKVSATLTGNKIDPTLMSSFPGCKTIPGTIGELAFREAHDTDDKEVPAGLEEDIWGTIILTKECMDSKVPLKFQLFIITEYQDTQISKDYNQVFFRDVEALPQGSKGTELPSPTP